MNFLVLFLSKTYKLNIWQIVSHSACDCDASCSHTEMLMSFEVCQTQSCVVIYMYYVNTACILIATCSLYLFVLNHKLMTYCHKYWMLWILYSSSSLLIESWNYHKTNNIIIPVVIFMRSSLMFNWPALPHQSGFCLL